MFQRVAEFHRAFGHPVADRPILPEPAVRTLRVNLLAEELQEFTDAHKAADRVEMADALADICYIIAGTVVAYGIGPTTIGTFESPYDRFLPREPHDGGVTRNLHDCFADYEMAEKSDNITWIDLSLMTMITSVFGVAWRLNLPLNAVFAEVHKSNMSKLMPDGSVLRREDGKILKGPNFMPPDIAGILGVSK
jgi:predicted HAD superfamily Cof-like phosphohydrolase